MRFFSGDYVPNLSVAPQELPTAWVMPWYLSRRHKNRLWALFVRGLQRFDERLHFVDLRWAERHYIEDGRIRLSQPVVARWRVDALSSADPASVVRFAFKWTRSGAVFDFDVDQDVPSFGWLGPFKVRVMHRIMDVLLDHPPLEDPQPIVNLLQEAAGLLLTPIELIDFIELMLERVIAGLSLESARAMAFGDAIAARFETVTNADIMEKVLREAAGSELSAMATRALTRMGLYELGARMPLLDLVRDPEIRQRALEAFARRMGEARSVEESFEEKPIEKPPEVKDVRDEVLEALPKAEPASPIVRDALARILDDRTDEGTKLLIDALRDGTAKRFSKEDAAVAGRALSRVAHRINISRLFAFSHKAGPNDLMLNDAASEYLTQAEEYSDAVKALISVANSALQNQELVTAKRVLVHAHELAGTSIATRVRADLLCATGAMHEKCKEEGAAVRAYEGALSLYLQVEDAYASTDVLIRLGALSIFALDLQRAQDYLVGAQKFASDIFEDSTISSMLGRICVFLGDYESAIKKFQRAMDNYEGIDDDENAADVAARLAGVLLRAGDFTLATQTYENSVHVDNAYSLLGMADLAMRAGNSADCALKQGRALAQFRTAKDTQGESRALHAIAKLKFITGEPFQEELDAAEKIASDIHDIHGLWLSKTLRSATLAPEEALLPLTECESFWHSKGLPWELCITRGLLAMFRNEPPEHIENILAPMIKSRAEVVASLVKTNRTRDALIAVLIELPTN